MEAKTLELCDELIDETPKVLRRLNRHCAVLCSLRLGHFGGWTHWDIARGSWYLEGGCYF